MTCHPYDIGLLQMERLPQRSSCARAAKHSHRAVETSRGGPCPALLEVSKDVASRVYMSRKIVSGLTALHP